MVNIVELLKSTHLAVGFVCANLMVGMGDPLKYIQTYKNDIMAGSGIWVVSLCHCVYI